jgi:hypothetical protein
MIIRADFYVSRFYPSRRRRSAGKIAARQQQDIAANRQAISHPQPRSVLGHAMGDERVVDGLSFDVSYPLIALGADEVRLIGEKRGYAQLTLQQFDMSLVRGLDTTEQDEEGFGVLLGEVFESLIVRFRAHGRNYGRKLSSRASLAREQTGKDSIID